MYFYVLIPSVPCNSDHSPPSRPSFPLPQCRIAGQIFIFLADLSAFPDIQHFFLFFYVDMFPEDLIVYFINKKCFNTFFCPQNHISNKKKGNKKKLRRQLRRWWSCRSFFTKSGVCIKRGKSSLWSRCCLQLRENTAGQQLLVG